MKKRILNIIIILFVLCIPLNLNAAKTKKLEICNVAPPAGLMYTKIDESDKPFEIKVYNFVAEGGKTAYCIHGGKKGPSSGDCKSTQLDLDFLKDGCDTGGNQYECGLARIISKGYGYVETMTALRMWTAAHPGETGDGIVVDSELEQTLAIKESVYRNTVNNMGKYNVRNPEMNYVLFQPNDEHITKSFELYNSATSGKIYTASFKVVDKKYEFDKNKRVTIEITTTLKDTNSIIEITPLKYAKFISKSCSGSNCSIVLEATIDLSRSGSLEIPIEITYKDSEDIMSKIKQYKIPNDGYQTFLVLEDGDEIKKEITVNVGPGQCDPSKACCPGNTYPENPKCQCDDINIKYNVPNNCTKGTEGTIEDPKLCAISLKESGKYKLKEINYDDDKNLCSVYCREKYEFKFNNELTAIAGRTFKYDVQVEQFKTPNKYLTIVKATRECASPKINYKQWKADFADINLKMLDAGNKWKFWQARIPVETATTVTTKCSGCSSCTNCCSPKLADAVTCGPSDPPTCVSKSAVWSNGPGASAPTQKNYTIYKWSKTGYYEGLPNGIIKYTDIPADEDNGSEGCECNECKGTSSANPTNGTSASEHAAEWETKYNGYKLKRDRMIDALKDCNFMLETGVIKTIGGYEYESNVKFDYEDKYSELTEFASEKSKNNISMRYCTGSNDEGAGCEIKTLCRECTAEISTPLSVELKQENLINWDCSGSSCENIQYAAPKSNVAYVRVISEEATYQISNFYTQIGTGLISTTQGRNYIPLEDSVGQTKYLYPLELNKKDGTYETILKYEGINEEFRKQLQLTKVEDIEYKCRINIKNEMPLCEGECSSDKPSLGFIFRPIDMGDIFPNNRLKGRNWTNAQNIIEEIEERDEDFWIKTKPIYTVTLLPENLKKIKRYNDSKNISGGYQDYSIECETDPLKPKYGHCESTFLKDILKNDYADKFIRTPSDNRLNDGYYWKR